VPLTFAPNDRPTLGVELELCLVDRGTRELTSAASAVLADLAHPSPDGEEPTPHPKAKHELFECTVEIITGVCATVAEARADLQTTLDELRAAADRRGLDVIGAGTHPFSRWRDQQVSPDDRYARLVDELQWTARRLAIFGAHFHVAVRSGERAIAIANALRTHLPVFLALSASSPYWEGEDSGLASARSKVFEGLPTAGLNPPIADWSEFESLIDTLVGAGCIRSIREIWWDVRPHPDFGTIELRMCDVPPTLTEAAGIAALAQSLVADLEVRVAHGEPLDRRNEWTVRENKWLAARHGIDTELIVDPSGTRRPVPDIVADLVDQLLPTAERLGCASELSSVLAICEQGPSYARQRAVRANGGSPADVVDHLVRELDRGEAILP
jgi:carboxylate-amine ligase